MKQFIIILFLCPVLAFAQTKSISLEDVYRKGTFRPEVVGGFNSMKDGRYYVESDGSGNLLKKSFATSETVETLIEQKDVMDEKGNTLKLDDIEWSTDEKKLLIFKNREYIYRRSSKAVVYVYDVANKSSVLVDKDKILHPTLSPDNSMIAYVKDNNLFVQNLKTKAVTEITKDGKWNSIINGNCDWVYEEEFSFTKAFEWSEKGNYIAYYRFDESKVPTYQFAIYDSLYPKQYSYKYPKAGEPNSVIEIHIYDVKTAKNVKADIGKETDIYIPRIKWTKTDNQLSITWLNRLQNEMKLLNADAATGKTTEYYKETNKQYVDIDNTEMQFLDNGKQYLITSELSGYKHIYLNSVDGKKSVQLTSGDYDVASIAGVDEKKEIVYFTAANRSPMNKDFCSVKFNGSDFKIIKQPEGTYTVSMNSDCSFALINYSNLTQPAVYSIWDVQNNSDRILKDNKKLAGIVKDYNYAKPEFIKVPTSKGETLNGWMLKPNNFDASKKYPVLFCNYGGPGSQQVANKWSAVNAWHQLLAQKGYIIVCVDNTGTGFRGETFKKKTYLQLGKYEIEDQIDAAKYLGTLNYIDANRIGHWGWSYGGFMSSLAITKGADVFKAAIAVAPVTSWRYYDNIYTERYMRTPKENAKGYDDNSPINSTKNINGKFLIIHGTADDNVHFQNSTMMITEMIKNNIEFESGYYPNKNHGISGGNTSFHIYNKMTKFILENL